MPARFAIASVDAPWSPRSANSSSAASRMSSRRSSALFRCGCTTMRPMLVTTHKLVKCRGHLVEILVGEPRMEGKRQRPLEGAVGTGKTTLLAVGTEPVDGVRADLRLDPLRPQAPQH